MKFKGLKTLALAFLTITASMSVSGQTSEDVTPPQRPVRQSTYQLVDEVRKEIGLDSKEFDKVYSAYEKYSKSVFGDDTSGPGQPPRSGNHPGGRPAGARPHGGMGGHGSGMSPHERGVGAPAGNHGDHQHGTFCPENKPKDIDVEKFEKTKTKAEEKLDKTIKKLFKKNPEKYESWLSLRQRQLENMFHPRPPHGDFWRDRDKSTEHNNN